MPRLCASALCLCFVPTSCVRVVSSVEFFSEDSRNPLCGEGGDVELGARTLKHILVFVFDYLSLNSSLFISRIAIIMHLYMLDIVLTLALIKKAIEAP